MRSNNEGTLIAYKSGNEAAPSPAHKRLLSDCSSAAIPTPSHAWRNSPAKPRDTRQKLTQALDMLENKRDENPPKKRGNISL